MSTTVPPTDSTPRRKRKTIVLALAVVAVLLGAGAAFAYWTTGGGSGAGSAKTGTGATSVTVVQDSTVVDLRPGGGAQELSGHFTNGVTDASDAYVTSVTASIGTIVKATDAVDGVCNASNYTLDHAVMNVDLDVPVGTSNVEWGVIAPEVATIQFFNKPAVNQDACKGATVNIVYSVS
jgi:hypothetical protein